MAWYTPIPDKMIQSFLHPENAYEDAAHKLEESWNEAQGYQNPFFQSGVGQLPMLTGAEKNLLNPEELQNKWASGYTESPYAKQSFNKAREAGMGAASSMGLMGSSAALGNIQQSASDIMNADRQQYMNDLMQKYMTGINLGQNIYGIGAGAGANLMRGRMGLGEEQAKLGFGADASRANRLMEIMMLARQLYGMGAGAGGGGAGMGA